MTSQKEILQAIAEYLTLNVEDIDKEALLREDLGLGTIELNDLLNNLAIKFDISFNPKETASLQTIEDLINMIEDNLID